MADPSTNNLSEVDDLSLLQSLLDFDQELSNSDSLNGNSAAAARGIAVA